MDKLTRWFAHLVDLKTLFSEWERRRVSGHPWTKRFREIHSVCMFILCMEYKTDRRYLIGFPQRGAPDEPVPLNRVFEDNFGEIEACDVLLVDCPTRSGQAVLHHRCQLVSYLNQSSTREVDIVRFLEKKKLKIARDDDLRLVIHVEQEGLFNNAFLSAYLLNRTPKCPYSQVFAFGVKAIGPRIWFCAQLYPQMITLNDLDEDSAKALVLDREPYDGTHPPLTIVDSLPGSEET